MCVRKGGVQSLGPLQIYHWRKVTEITAAPGLTLEGMVALTSHNSGRCGEHFLPVWKGKVCGPREELFGSLKHWALRRSQTVTGGDLNSFWKPFSFVNMKTTLMGPFAIRTEASLHLNQCFGGRLWCHNLTEGVLGLTELPSCCVNS